MEDIVLVGYGGHAKSVADCIEREGKFHIVGYTDVQKGEAPYPYLGTDDVLNQYFRDGVLNAAICIGYLGKGDLREKLYCRLKDIGFQFPVIADSTAIISQSAKIGEGTFIGKKAIVNAEADIGKMCIINSAAVIEHECVIDDFVHVAAGTVLCGQVMVGKAAFIGANATVIQGIEILPRQIVGAGVTIRGAYMDNIVKTKENLGRVKPNYKYSHWMYSDFWAYICPKKGERQWA